MSTNSESVRALLPALAKAIADMPNPKKNSNNPAFRSKFADLGEVLDCIAEPLAAHGLLMTQTVRDGALVTRCWHCESGEWIESAMALRPDKDTPQGMGSAITYARRYALKAMFGMRDDDDDGNAASGRAPSTNRAAAPKAADKPAPAPTVEPFGLAEQAIAALNAVEDEKDLAAIGERVKASGFKGEDVKLVREAWTRATHELKGA